MISPDTIPYYLDVNEFRKNLHIELISKNRPVDVEFLFEYDHFLNGHFESSLDQDVKRFLAFILHAYMPFGILNLTVFDIASKILDGYNDSNALRNEFDRLIPKKYVPNTIDGKRGMLDRLEEITNILRNGIRQGRNALDYFNEHYFDFNLTSLQDSDDEFIHVRNRIMDNQTTYNFRIENIFKVSKRNENEIISEATNNETRQLIHATYPNNILGILKEGLR